MKTMIKIIRYRTKTVRFLDGVMRYLDETHALLKTTLIMSIGSVVAYLFGYVGTASILLCSTIIMGLSEIAAAIAIEWLKDNPQILARLDVRLDTRTTNMRLEYEQRQAALMAWVTKRDELGRKCIQSAEEIIAAIDTGYRLPGMKDLWGLTTDEIDKLQKDERFPKTVRVRLAEYSALVSELAKVDQKVRKLNLQRDESAAALLRLDKDEHLA